MGKKKNKKTKSQLVFSETDRVDFITGFKKRKDIRRAKAKVEKEQLVKEARKQVKREKREELKKLVVDTEQRHAAFRDHIQPEQLEFDEHLVTITSMDLNAMASQVNCALGSNQSQTVPDDDQS